VALASRTAVVTGANRGIGLQITKELAEKGYTVIATSRNVTDVQTAMRQLVDAGRKIICHALDIADQASVDSFAQFIKSEVGAVDVLVNNAGVYTDGSQVASSPDFGLVQSILDTNLFGAWRMCKALIPAMRDNGYGRIVNVSSGMGKFDALDGGKPGYRMSKTALNCLTRMLAVELQGTGILVNSADPGWVRTDMGSSAAPRSVEEGADTPLWLATLPDDGPNGGFFFDRKLQDW
jgi:NAD(P)-dependent dehydrogenase (short-subunit alcohol dehydrogenase family)